VYAYNFLYYLNIGNWNIGYILPKPGKANYNESKAYGTISLTDILSHDTSKGIHAFADDLASILCVIKSNWVVLRPRVYAEIEGNSQNWRAGAPPPCGGGVAAPQKYALPHVCHSAKFDRCMSKTTSVIK